MADPQPVRLFDPADAPAALVLVGCGGTGGFVARNAARLLWGLQQARLQARRQPAFGPPAPEGVPGVLIADGDEVERGNVVRQDFLPADVGRAKALVLAERLTAAYGLEVSAYPRYLGASGPFGDLIPEESIVVGCVDNAATRRLLHERLSRYRNVVYLDSGNGAVSRASHAPGRRPSRVDLRRERESGWSGQVVCGVRKGGETLLPFPGDAMPDLLEGDGPEDGIPDEIPCHAVVETRPQRFLTNLRAATVIMEYLGPLLADGHLLHARTFFDARRGYAKSYPAVDELDEVAV